MATIENRLYRGVRKDEFTAGVLTEDGEAMEGILHEDIDPRTVIVRGNAMTLRRTCRLFGLKAFLSLTRKETSPRYKD